MDDNNDKKQPETLANTDDRIFYEIISGVKKVAKLANQVAPEDKTAKELRIAEQNAARQAAWRERQKAINADLLAKEQVKTAELEAKLAAATAATPVNTAVEAELARLKAENEALRVELAKPSPVIAPTPQMTPELAVQPVSKITLGVLFALMAAAGFALRSCV